MPKQTPLHFDYVTSTILRRRDKVKLLLSYFKQGNRVLKKIFRRSKRYQMLALSMADSQWYFPNRAQMLSVLRQMKRWQNMELYYTRTGKWQLAGITGFFFYLTNSIGVFVLLPLLYEGLMPLLKENKDLKSFKNSRGKILSLFYLSLIPLGIIFSMIFGHYLTGDFLAFALIR